MPTRSSASCSVATRCWPPPRIWQASPPQNLNLPSTLNACRPSAGWKRTPCLLQPQAGVEAVADQHLGQFGIAAVFGQPAHVVEILALAYSCRSRWSPDRDRQYRAPSCSRSSTVGILEAEGAAGECGVAAARLLRCGFDQGDGRARLMRRQRGVGRGVAGADDQHIDMAEFRRCHASPPRPFPDPAIAIGGTRLDIEAKRGMLAAHRGVLTRGLRSYRRTCSGSCQRREMSCTL